MIYYGTRRLEDEKSRKLNILACKICAINLSILAIIITLFVLCCVFFPFSFRDAHLIAPENLLSFSLMSYIGMFLCSFIGIFNTAVFISGWATKWDIVDANDVLYYISFISEIVFFGFLITNICMVSVFLSCAGYANPGSWLWSIIVSAGCIFGYLAYRLSKSIAEKIYYKRGNTEQKDNNLQKEKQEQTGSHMKILDTLDSHLNQINNMIKTLQQNCINPLEKELAGLSNNEKEMKDKITQNNIAYKKFNKLESKDSETKDLLQENKTLENLIEKIHLSSAKIEEQISHYSTIVNELNEQKMIWSYERKILSTKIKASNISSQMKNLWKTYDLKNDFIQKMKGLEDQIDASLELEEYENTMLNKLIHSKSDIEELESKYQYA